MSFSAHYLFAVLLTIVSLPTSLWAQSAPKQTLKIAHGSISGRVMLKEKGVFGVAVALRKLEQSNSNERVARAMTDQDGFYRITDVAPGTYEVSPSVPAFVPTDSREPRKNVIIGEDENVENIDFKLVRGGVITGRVTDADGHPVIAQRVYIYRAGDFKAQQRGQQPQVFPLSGAPTDDRGIYRVFGLVPGKYKVAAGRSENAFTNATATGSSSYTQVFHPEATESSKAVVIEVGEGTEATNVDITLGRALPTFSAAGLVIDSEKNLPAPNVRVMLQRRVGQRIESSSVAAVSNAQGEFLAQGLIPGKYEARLVSNEGDGIRAERVTFDVIDQDVSGITIKLVQGASLSGVVELETPNAAAVARFSELRLRVYVNDPETKTGSSGVATVAPNGSFSVTGLTGGIANVFLTAAIGAVPPKGFSLVRVERDGAVMSRGIPIQERERVTGLHVVLAYGTATIRGVVEVENGTLPSSERIFIALLRPDERINSMRPPPVDARGRFVIEGVAPGTYVIQAVISMGPNVRGRIARREITIQDGVTTEVTLTVDMNPPPQKP